MEDDEDFSNGLLLRDIEEISKALYLHSNPATAFNASSDQRASIHAKTHTLKFKSEVDNQDSLHVDKKSSIWNWKPLKALAHIRNHRFNCCFFLYVHAIEGLPSNFDNLNLSVTWERKGDMLRTFAVPVFEGMAEFEETLMYRCTVYASRTKNPSSAKYESKLFSLRTSVIGVPELEIGKHWIDLTRLLPLTMEEMKGEKRSSGKWTTSFKLSGKAKDAVLNVSFGFSILDGNSFEPGHFLKVPGVVRKHELLGDDRFAEFGRDSGTHQLHNLGSVSTDYRQDSHRCSLSDGKLNNGNFSNRGSELSRSISLLYQKLDEGKRGTAVEYDFFHKSLEPMKMTSGPSPDSAGGRTGNEYNATKFAMFEKGVEASTEERMKVKAADNNLLRDEEEIEHGSQRFDSSLIETIDVAEIFRDEESELDENVELIAKLEKNDCDDEEISTSINELKENVGSVSEPTFEELDSIFYEMLTLRSKEFDSVADTKNYYEQENCNAIKSGYNEINKSTKSCSLDEIAESIENDFLSMLSLEIGTAAADGPGSPKDLVLWKNEETTIAWGNPISDIDTLTGWKLSFEELASSDGDEDDDDLLFSIQAAEKNRDSLIKSSRSKRNAKLLENMETESLMHEWGLNERAFQKSPRCSSGAFGSPVYIPAEEPLRLPSLAEGTGPIIRTKDGGFVRSMNPLLFSDAKNGARLVVQVSAPVVLPATMGLTAMEILQCWASAGAEKILTQAKELMPLEDITGMTMEELASEATPSSDASGRWNLKHEAEGGFAASFEMRAADRIRFISLSERPSFSIENDTESDYVCFENLVPTVTTNFEGLLIEGLKIQSGMPDQEPPSRIRSQSPWNSAYIGKTADPHGNLSSDTASSSQFLDVDKLIKLSVSLEKWIRLDCGDDAQDEPEEDILKLMVSHGANCSDFIKDGAVKRLDRTCGIFDNYFIMALRVQLRDPLRNYEMVGSSMLALIQVERVYEDCLDENLIRGGIDSKQEVIIMDEKRIPLFKISEVQLAGLNVLLGRQQFWSGNRQKQSGYRWLLSSGMARSNKHQISSLNAIVKSSSRLEGGNILWSISPRTGDEVASWDEVVALNVHVRNPDIIIPYEFSEN